MKSLLTFALLGTASLLAADPYSQPYGSSGSQNQPYYRDNEGQMSSYHQGAVQFQEESEEGKTRTGASSQNQGRTVYPAPEKIQSQAYYRDNQENVSPYHQGAVQFQEESEGGKTQTGASSQNQGRTVYPAPEKIQSQAYYRDNQNNVSSYHQGAVQFSETPEQNPAPTAQPKAVPKSENNQDQALTKAVGDLVKGGWFSKGYEGVTFTVNNGIVTLRGTVATIEKKNKLVEDVKKFKGVTRIDDQVAVKKI